MSGFRYEKDGDKIVTISLDLPAGPVSSETISRSLDEVIARLESDDVAGVVIASGKEPFSSRASARELLNFPKLSRKDVYDRLAALKVRLRRLESLGKPVVAAIGDNALGAEFEIFLAAHHRVAVNRPDLLIGLPDVAAGLLPSLGGLVRLVYLLGLEKALPLLQDGVRLSPEKACEVGLINELVADADDLLSRAKTWIKANPAAAQAWDKKGYQIPGGTPAHPRIAQMIITAPAILRKKNDPTRPTQEAILCAAVEGAQVDLDSALRIESRYLVELLFSGAKA
ncbi:MAG: enoyl-CoA hydratase/isomerase family protein [Desulfuromonadales bacterium]|nr:enoyl-CoA hydratase/isomerase family protein [Desulfuromonadales bacterium]